MARTIEGNIDARGLKFAIIAARFNSFIVERLLEGAMDALRRTGADLEALTIVKVPGSWEMPVVAAELARQKRYDGAGRRRPPPLHDAGPGAAREPR